MQIKDIENLECLQFLCMYMYIKYHRDYKVNYLNFNCNLIKGVPDH